MYIPTSIVILIAVLIIIIIGELSAWAACGVLLFDCDKMDINLEKYFLNPVDYKILSCQDGPFIGTVVHPFFAKYYIFKVGRVPRWSELHKRIEERRRKLNPFKY